MAQLGWSGLGGFLCTPCLPPKFLCPPARPLICLRGLRLVLPAAAACRYVGGLRRLTEEERQEWRRHGAPTPPAPEQLQVLEAAAAEEEWSDDEEGLDLDLGGWISGWRWVAMSGWLVGGGGGQQGQVGRQAGSSVGS